MVNCLPHKKKPHFEKLGHNAYIDFSRVWENCNYVEAGKTKSELGQFCTGMIPRFYRIVSFLVECEFKNPKSNFALRCFVQ